MSKPIKIVTIIGVAFLGLACAAYVGFKSGSNLAIQEDFACQTLHTNSELRALQNLHEQKYDLVQSNLETIMGVGVTLIGSEGRFELMNKRTKNLALETLRDANNYLLAHPLVYPGESMKKRISAALKNGLENAK